MRAVVSIPGSLFWFALCVLLAEPLHGQGREFQLKFDVTSVTMAEDDNRLLLRQAMDMLTEALESRGAIRSEAEGFLFLIGVSNPDEAGNIALSIATLYKLPESIVQWGKREQAFYMKTSGELQDDLPSEGRYVREYMSEEFMRSFAQIQGNYVEIVRQSELRAGIQEIVDRFYALHMWR